MVAINFKSHFVDAISEGKKRQTIREMRKRPFKIGDKLQLYTQQRTKNSRLLLETEAVDVQRIKMTVVCCPIDRQIQIGNFILSLEAKEKLAQQDGFNSLDEFWDFFFDNPDKEMEGFEGQLIKWGCLNCKENNSGIPL